MIVHGVVVKGVEVDSQTRCKHYHTERDIIAIKFKCCDTYYPCHLCHEECADHKALTWPKEEWNEKAILCGNCGEELTINEYMNSKSTCPNCSASFNPGCQLHYHLYFD
ncbi:putative CHY-type Zn-finger protein [Bacillus pakistanensis]|uniref:CHY-type Zn-finger protein n=1 Tax=Rossellomorea pakistanensis TaxID=992288 RepID=A0ABS2NGW2_9BACI|nr:CHY zinc finger protein [Bacillus pakistanensis]MBM7587063.1 putative CHY-type Zn-finger protein [Bacillus pakistanensis]